MEVGAVALRRLVVQDWELSWKMSRFWGLPTTDLARTKLRVDLFDRKQLIQQKPMIELEKMIEQRQMIERVRMIGQKQMIGQV